MNSPPNSYVDAGSKLFRFTLLFFNCLLSFGAFYSVDMPSSVQTELQDDPTNETSNGNSNSSTAFSCPGCLGLGPFNYNLIYSIYSWSFASCVMFVGVFLDKVGDKVGAVVFSCLVLIGSCIFALGVMTPLVAPQYTLYPLLFGRILLGGGISGTRIVQDRVTSFWFKNKEMTFAFGCTIMFSRLGSVVSFLVTQHVVAAFGLAVMAWGAACLCAVGFLAALVLVRLQTFAVDQLGLQEKLDRIHSNVSILNVTKFPASFWLLALVCVAFYSSLQPSTADCSKYYQDRWGVSRVEASLLEGLLFDVTMVMAPLLGAVLDRWRGKAYTLVAGCLLLTLTNVLTAFTPLPPAAMSCMLGLAYALSAISIWPTVPLLVPREALGMAMGVLFLVRNLGTGLLYTLVGEILNSSTSPRRLPQWQMVHMMLAAIAGSAFLFAVVLIRVDRSRGNVFFNMTIRVETKDPTSETEPLLAGSPRFVDHPDIPCDTPCSPSSPLVSSTPAPSLPVASPTFNYPPCRPIPEPKQELRRPFDGYKTFT